MFGAPWRKRDGPVNPPEEYDGEHLEWVGPLRLCLPPPSAGSGMTLWRGARLHLRTGSIADLIASKLIRYDETDRSDIQYLLRQARTAFADIAAATERLPAPFASDALVRENLENLRTDMDAWSLQNDSP